MCIRDRSQWVHIVKWTLSHLMSPVFWWLLWWLLITRSTWHWSHFQAHVFKGWGYSVPIMHFSGGGSLLIDTLALKTILLNFNINSHDRSTSLTYLHTSYLWYIICAMWKVLHALWHIFLCQIDVKLCSVERLDDCHVYTPFCWCAVSDGTELLTSWTVGYVTLLTAMCPWTMSWTEYYYFATVFSVPSAS